ncbi:MAG: polysaccharide biosynthesis C-terminal domain-containing protein [Clostridia bacterium]|nr:polysaccharide biosynthesis C-terminal domain-containing protein [Clostridia bacterium]
MVAFTIAFTTLLRNIKLNLGFKKLIFKPLIATIIMGICSYFIFNVLNGIIVEKMATIIAIVVAVLIYAITIVVLKIFTKEEINMLPCGAQIYKILEKIKIY